jgi:hypothetical protein
MIFRMFAMGCGPHHASHGYGYVSMFDGVKVGTWSQRFDSPDEVVDELNKFSGRAAWIVERGPKLDAEGSVVAERLVAIVHSPSSGEQMAELVWTDGRRVCFISSTSLPHVLAFERAQELPKWLSRWIIN